MGNSRSRRNENEHEAEEVKEMEDKLVILDKKSKNSAAEEDPDDVKAVSTLQLFKYSTCFERFLMIVGAFAGCATGLTMPFFSIIFGEVLDQFSQTAPAGDDDFFQTQAKQPALLFTYLMCATFVVGFAQMGLFTIAAERQTLRIRQKYLTAVLAQEIAWFDSRQSGELSTKIAENTVIIREAIGDKLGNLFQFLSMFFGGFAIGFYFNYKLTLILVGMLPALGLGGYIVMKATADLTGKGLGAYAKAGSIVQEALVNIRTVTAFNGQQDLQDSYDAQLHVAEKQGIKKGFRQGLGMGFTTFAMFCCYALAFSFGAIFIEDDRQEAFEDFPLNQASVECQDLFSNFSFGLNAVDFCGSAEGILLEIESNITCDCGCSHPDAACLSGGDVTLVFFSVLMASFALGQAAPSLTALRNGQVAAAKIYEVIDREPEIDGSTSSSGKKHDLKGSITFENIHFAYPTRREVKVFDNFNLVIPEGQSTALVGGSGCGKSTAMALIQRFYDPDEGRVLFDNEYDLKDLDLSYIRNQFGLVSQEPVLFATTVAENIALGAKLGEVASMEEIIAAAKAANAYDFIMGFPDQFNTLVGSGGAQLSGGQKQRIAIARALLRQPTFLLLDEATSALDNESERIVQKALDGLLEQRNRTTIVIAHRLSTIRNCDNIVVLGEGKVLEQGTHDELLGLDGVYTMLVAAANQTQEREDERIVDEMKSDDIVEAVVLESSAVQDIDGEEQKGEEEEKEKLYKVGFCRLLAMSKPEACWFIPASLAAALNGAVFPVFALYLSDIMITLFEPDTSVMREDARLFSFIFLGLASTAFLAYFMQNWGFGIIAERLTRRVRYLLFDTLLRKQMSFFDVEANSVGALSSRLSTDAALVKANISDRLSLTVMNLVTVGVGFTLAFINGWQLTLVLLGAFPLISIAGAVQLVAAASMAKADDKYLQPASSVLQESISGIRTVTAFNAKDRVVTLYKQYLAVPMKLGTKKGIYLGFGFGLSQGLIMGLYGFIFYIGAIFIDQGIFDFQEMLRVFFLIVFTAFGLGQTVALAPDVAKGGVAVSNVFKIVDEETEIDPKSQEGATAVDDFGFHLQDVQFTYPSRPDVKILKDLTISGETGKTIALVGSSGSGKSTVISLLERFYDVDEGSVVVGHSEIQSLNIGWLREKMSLVEQEPKLFATSIMDNIKFGCQDATEEDVIAAAQAANAHDFIVSFPEGYDTLVGEQGTQLSGGQKQRICIARAIIRKPSLLLLDEATSALDNVSEKVVQRALDRYVQERNMTTVVIAHRLTTIQGADKIIVFAHGRVLEEGTHTELLEKGGAYFNLWQAQGDQD